MKNQSILFIIVAVVLTGVGGFFGGMKYQESKSPAFNIGGIRGDRTGQFARNLNSNQRNFRPVNGEVLNIDEKSLTIKNQDGSSKIILLNEKTAVRKTEDGTFSDIKKGSLIMIVGTENSDGSVTAQNIQLNPQFRTGMNEGEGSASANSL